MFDFKSLDVLFAQISRRLAFLETAERKEVIRSLRDLYFFPNEFLSLLNRLIETNATNPEPIIAEGRRRLTGGRDIEKALNFITSQTVATNLQLSLDMVEELRRIADLKEGVRAELAAIFFSWMFERDPAKVVELAKESLKNIEYLNGKIRSLEGEIKNSKG